MRSAEHVALETELLVLDERGKEGLLSDIGDFDLLGHDVYWCEVARLPTRERWALSVLWQVLGKTDRNPACPS